MVLKMINQKNKVLKYYIEFVLIIDSFDAPTENIIQSKWFETKEEALKWYHTSFDDVDYRVVSAQLRTAEFNDKRDYRVIDSEDIEEILKMSLIN